MEGQGAGAESESESESEPEPRLSGARGQTWPAQDKYRLEIKRGKWETQPEPAETTAIENKHHRGLEKQELVLQGKGGGETRKETEGPELGGKKREKVDKREKDGDQESGTKLGKSLENRKGNEKKRGKTIGTK